MTIFTFIADWLLIALGGALWWSVMLHRIDAEIREEELDEWRG